MPLNLNHFRYALVSAGLISIGSFIWCHSKIPLIALVDMQRLLNQPATLLSKSNLSEKEQKNVLRRYSALLPKVLSEYGESHKVTLITATVISSGTLDVTDEIIDITLEKLKAS